MRTVSVLSGSWLTGSYAVIFISPAVLYRLAPDSRKRLGLTAFMAVCSLAEARERLDDESSARALGTGQQDLLSQIKNFFL